MARLTIRFYEELNDFLPPERRKRAFEHRVEGCPAVKDVIESLGVPHVEVELILINGRSVGFEEQVSDGDRIAVYPVFESLDVSPLVRVRPEPLRVPRFVLDVHLGKLARLLRLLGQDTLYTNAASDPELAAISARESRILLTRDRGLLKRSEVTRGYCVRATHPRRQLDEVVERFELWGRLAPFTRCLACNGLLASASPESVAGDVPPTVLQRQRDFARCQSCGRIFWRGSHHAALARIVASHAKEGREGARPSRP